MLLERFLKYYPCLQQAIHYLFYSDVYISIFLVVVQVILVYDIFSNELDYYPVRFNLLHWIVQNEVIFIYNKVFFFWGGEYSVLREFGHD